MSGIWRYFVAFLVWPGLIGGVLLGWLYMWIARKLTARLQGRRGPPFYQPFFDFVKLLGKQTLVPDGVSRITFHALPLVSLVATGIALALIPVPGNPLQSFAGDVILLLYLFEVPVICDVLAGYVSRSLYGQVSSAREALLSLGHNLPFLAAVVALSMHAGSFRMSALHAAPWGPVHVAAFLAFLVSIPARLKSNPFSIPNAEQEIVAGTHIEFNAAPLAFFELSHAVEMVALLGLFFVLFVPPLASQWLSVLVYAAVSIILLLLVTFVAVITARIKANQALWFYWVWGGAAAAAAFAAAVIW